MLLSNLFFFTKTGLFYNEYIKSIKQNIIKVDEVKQIFKHSHNEKMILPKHEHYLLKHINIYDIFKDE